MEKRSGVTQLLIDYLDKVNKMSDEEFNAWMKEVDATPLDPNGVGSMLLDAGYFDRFDSAKRAKDGAE